MKRVETTLALLAALGLLMAGCEKKSDPPKKEEAAPSGGSDKGGAGAKPGAAKVDRPSYPGTLEGAKKLCEEFLAPGADMAALTKRLRPDPADYAAFFAGPLAETAKKAYEAAWDAGQITVSRKPKQTQVVIWEAKTEQLSNEPKGNMMKSDARNFPGGYAKAAKHMQPGLTVYRWKFVEAGKELGTGWDGLTHVNGHWAFFPKPWRVVPGGQAKDQMGMMFDSMSPYDLGKMLKERKK